MAERVQRQDQAPLEQAGTVSGKAGTSKFVVKVPKDQIYKIPPPENAKRYADYTRRKPNRRSSCCRCIIWTMIATLIIIIVIAIAAGTLYLILRPKLPRYTIEKISVSGFDSNLTRSSSSPSIRMKFSVAFRAVNPNEKICVDYERISSVTISHSETDLCDGEFPYFQQPARNVTLIRMDMSGSEIVGGGAVYDALVRDDRAGKVPLAVRIEAPVKMMFGNVKSWKMRVVVQCRVVLDKMSEKARIAAGGCGGAKMMLW